MEKAKLLDLIETIKRPLYDVDYVIGELRKIDAGDSFIQDAIEHIRGANGQGSFKNHEYSQNLVWAVRSLRNYIADRLQS